MELPPNAILAALNMTLHAENTNGSALPEKFTCVYELTTAYTFRVLHCTIHCVTFCRLAFLTFWKLCLWDMTQLCLFIIPCLALFPFSSKLLHIWHSQVEVIFTQNTGKCMFMNLLWQNSMLTGKMACNFEASLGYALITTQAVAVLYHTVYCKALKTSRAVELRSRQGSSAVSVYTQSILTYDSYIYNLGLY